MMWTTLIKTSKAYLCPDGAGKFIEDSALINAP